LLFPSLSPFWAEQSLAVECPQHGRWILSRDYAKRGIRELSNEHSEKKIFVYDWKSFELFFLEEKIKPPNWKIYDLLIAGWLCDSARTDPSLPELAKKHLDQTLPEKLEKTAEFLSLWISTISPLGKKLTVQLQACGLETIYETMERPL